MLLIGKLEPRALGMARSQEVAEVGRRGGRVCAEDTVKCSRRAVRSTRLWQGVFSVGGPDPVVWRQGCQCAGDGVGSVCTGAQLLSHV